jgi:large subunit ribosomal protein L22
MAKATKKEPEGPKSYRAAHRFARISPTKVRPIADLVRGKSIAEAQEVLKFMPNRGARFLEKVIASATANAEDQAVRNVEELEITLCCIDEGPRMKRFQPRARGSAFPIIKRMSHIRVEIG